MTTLQRHRPRDFDFVKTREFWASADIQNKIRESCELTRDWLLKNENALRRVEAFHDHRNSESEREFYIEEQRPWFQPPAPVSDAVRLQLRLDRLADIVREQGLIDLLWRRLSASLPDEFCLTADDWARVLNANSLSVLDETLGALEAPDKSSRLPFDHLKRVYGFKLKTPVTRLVTKMEPLHRLGLFYMHWTRRYEGSCGPVYSNFYRIAYQPVRYAFIKKMAERKNA